MYCAAVHSYRTVVHATQNKWRWITPPVPCIQHPVPCSEIHAVIQKSNRPQNSVVEIRCQVLNMEQKTIRSCFMFVASGVTVPLSCRGAVHLFRGYLGAWLMVFSKEGIDALTTLVFHSFSRSSALTFLYCFVVARYRTKTLQEVVKHCDNA